MAHLLFTLIISITIFDYLFDRFLDYLNMKNFSSELPKEAEGIYDVGKYKKSQEYYRANHNFSMITSTFSFVVMLGMLSLNGFAFVDSFVRSFTIHPITMALMFFGILGTASGIIGLPFSLYSTFVIEEKFGFNKTTIKTFFFDKIKGTALSVIIGAPLLALIVWFYQSTGNYFWIYTWAIMTVFMIFATMFYASIILPLFNKLKPMEKGELRTAIEAYCSKVGFKLDNLFVMDGSKRSSKANAFFSGLGSRKKIVLFDTLIEKHTTEELVAVLAHEVGHYKKKHTLQAIILSVIQTGLTLFIMSLFINSSSLSEALGAREKSFHIGILAFGILYGPLSEIMGIGMNILSRKNEFEADSYAAETYAATSLSTALKKLSVDSLSNLKPHPAYVFVHYSHPPLLQRLKNLKRYF